MIPPNENPIWQNSMKYYLQKNGFTGKADEQGDREER